MRRGPVVSGPQEWVVELDDDGEDWGTPVHAVFPRRVPTRLDEVLREDDGTQDLDSPHTHHNSSTPMQEFHAPLTQPWTSSSSSSIMEGESSATSSMFQPSAAAAIVSRGSREVPMEEDLLVEEDLDEFQESDEELDAALARASAARAAATSAAGGSGGMSVVGADLKPLSVAEGIRLKRALLGSESRLLPNAWLSQGFFFNDSPTLEFGLWQNEGGPCGVLAVVQAFLLKHVLFNSADKRKFPSLPPDVRDGALKAALCEILWEIATESDGIARVVGSVKRQESGLRFESLMFAEFRSRRLLDSFVDRNFGLFNNPKGLGVVLFTMSAMLTRGLDMLAIDMDESSGLIAQHGYCSQEMINLMILGRATSNVFDHTMSVEGSDHVLKGAHKQSAVGFLSLFEHYDIIRVGSFFKDPQFPIWVICSESHYTVAFCLTKPTAAQQQSGVFDILWYDQLARMERLYTLTIDNTHDTPVSVDSSEDLVPPMDEVLRTKWPNARVDWNGEEPFY